MKKVSEEVVNSLIVNFPWYLVEVIEGVDVNSIYKEGFAEIEVENKFQGKYMNICKVILEPDWESCSSKDLVPLAFKDDVVCVWSTAVENFKILEYAEVSLIRNADIFIRIPAGTPLYEKIIKNYEKSNTLQV